MPRSYLEHRIYGGRPAVSTGRVVRVLQRLNAEGVAPTLSQVSEQLPDLRKEVVSRALRQLTERAGTQRIPLAGAEHIGTYVLGSTAHMFRLELSTEQQLQAAEAESFLAQIAQESPEDRAERARARRMRSSFYRNEAQKQARAAAGLSSQVSSQPPG